MFVFAPPPAEPYAATVERKGNPNPDRDWGEVRTKARSGRYRYLTAHWAATEARFRRHFKPLKGDPADFIDMEDKLIAITQDDVIKRRFLDESHRAYVPDFGCTIEVDDDKGGTKHLIASRQVVLFCVERRRAWRMLQSKAGIENPDYKAQRATLERWDTDHPEGGPADHAALRAIFDEELDALLPKKKTPAPVA